jgi:dihydrofolate synthase/folylpolyglutamate synthase
MRNLLSLIQNPHHQYPVIHVAGTKGKGSVSALMASALSAGGYQTGLYTSPHLQDYCERIQINGQPISHEDFVKLVDEIKPFIPHVEKITTFELSTALAFMYFSKKKIDIAVIEVGLGGRLDATNVVDPLVSVITSISYDHMDILGDTLAKIAGEKAGIIKSGRPVVVSMQKLEAMGVIEAVALERGSQIYDIDSLYQFEPLKHSLSNQSFSVKKKDDSQEKAVQFEIPLLGKHQIENAVTALAALNLVDRAGINISKDSIIRGFSTVYWPARFEILRYESPIIVVDSAHNRDSALRLRETLDDYLPGKPVKLIFGASEDKDIDGMMDELSPRVSQVVATRSIHPRAMSVSTIMESAQKYQLPVIIVEPVEAALKYAMDTAKEDEVVLVAGSLFVSAAARDTWEKMGMPLRGYQI